MTDKDVADRAEAQLHFIRDRMTDPRAYAPGILLTCGELIARVRELENELYERPMPACAIGGHITKEELL